MSEPFLGEIRMFPYTFAPRGWAACEGQLLPISQNQALFALLGTTYGGNGQTTFALPDLRGRVLVGAGTAASGTVYEVGEAGGEEAHALVDAELPRHRHRAVGSAVRGTADSPENAVWGPVANHYARNGSALMGTGAIAPAGEDRPHNTMQPYLALKACIALFGIFPSQS